MGRAPLFEYMLIIKSDEAVVWKTFRSCRLSENAHANLCMILTLEDIFSAADFGTMRRKPFMASVVSPAFGKAAAMAGSREP